MLVLADTRSASEETGASLGELPCSNQPWLGDVSMEHWSGGLRGEVIGHGLAFPRSCLEAHLPPRLKAPQAAGVTATGR
jgi:hypothetical protein